MANRIKDWALPVLFLIAFLAIHFLPVLVIGYLMFSVLYPQEYIDQPRATHAAEKCGIFGDCPYRAAARDGEQILCTYHAKERIAQQKDRKDSLDYVRGLPDIGAQRDEGSKP